MIGAAATHRSEDGLQASAEAILACRADALFAVLADPALHPEIDGGATLATAVDASVLTGVGDAFGMDLAHGVRVVCRVRRFEQDRVIAWEPGLEDAPPSGQVWTWTLAPEGEGTRVRVAYDGTGLAPEDSRRRARARALDPRRLVGSLCRLEALARTAPLSG